MTRRDDDPRNIRTGRAIPAEHYCDQPYVVAMPDGTWVCLLTTGAGVEGEPGQHIVATSTRDFGATWSPLVDIEPAGGPEASWVMPLLTPLGRIYAFYTYNADNMRQVHTGLDQVDGEVFTRVDTFGRYAFKYSDDGGRTWSKRRYIPIRNGQWDRENPYRGDVQFFWGVGKPMIDGDDMFFGYAKVGAFGEGFMARSEGWVIHSPNILTERDADKLTFNLLPDGDIGCRAPQGTVCDEMNVVALSDGSLYGVCRTTGSSPAHFYSRDRGHTWTPPAHAVYQPGGRRIRHPRAACFVRKYSNDKFTLWHHNYGGNDYGDRNPAWLSGGVEVDSPQGKVIHWSQPEIVLFDPDPNVRISYPDFIEQDGRYFITETQKSIARVHEIDPSLLDGLWRQHENSATAKDGLMDVSTPLPRLSDGGGFTLDFDVAIGDPTPGRVLCDARRPHVRGWTIRTAPRGAVQLELCDSERIFQWDCDAELILPDRTHHVTFVIDGSACVVSVLVDGQLCDGRGERRYGFGRLDPNMGDVSGVAAIKQSGEVRNLRIYNRALRTSEAVGNARAASR